MEVDSVLMPVSRDFKIQKEEMVKLRQCHRRGLCDPCLGRLLAKRSTGLTNDERGVMIRTGLDGAKEVRSIDCWLCEGLVDEYDKFAGLVAKALEEIEHSSFLIGSKIDQAIKDREKEAQEILGGNEFEEIGSEANREIGKRVYLLTQREVDFKNPDIVALVDTRFDRIKLEVRSVFLYGRYRKLKRGIPQTKWPCRSCRGKGCRRCNDTGRMYQSSVEEKIAGPIVQYLKGRGQSFHGMGREDIDARMLGNGRPFVLEVKGPRVRSLTREILRDLEAKVNRIAKDEVEIEGLRPSSKVEVRTIKGRRCYKTYVIEVDLGQRVERECLEKAVASLSDTTIDQRTPKRVAHRRGDLVRKRKIRNMSVLDVKDRIVILKITGEAGIYIKELITGDEGRTEPSLHGKLGLDCKVLGLDVSQIHDDEVEV